MNDDHWKERCLILADALSNVLDGVPRHDLKAMTGLGESKCNEIYDAKLLADEIAKDHSEN